MSLLSQSLVLLQVSTNFGIHSTVQTYLLGLWNKLMKEINGRSIEVILNSSTFWKEYYGTELCRTITETDTNTDLYKDKQQQSPSNGYEIF